MMVVTSHFSNFETEAIRKQILSMIQTTNETQY